jgi:hypothetical protein
MPGYAFEREALTGIDRRAALERVERVGDEESDWKLYTIQNLADAVGWPRWKVREWLRARPGHTDHRRGPKGVFTTYTLELLREHVENPVPPVVERFTRCRNAWYTVGDLACLFGVTQKTVRLWLDSVGRPADKYRRNEWRTPENGYVKGPYEYAVKYKPEVFRQLWKVSRKLYFHDLIIKEAKRVLGEGPILGVSFGVDNQGGP